MTDLKLAVRDDCAVSACAPTPESVYKCSHLPLVGGGGVGGGLAFAQMSATLPLQLLPPEIKQTFLSTNLACLLPFEQQAAGLPAHPPSFGNNNELQIFPAGYEGRTLPSGPLFLPL